MGIEARGGFSPFLLAAALFGLGQQHHGPIEADAEHLFGAREAGVFSIVGDIGAVTPDRRGYGLAALRVRADLARQREQGKRLIEADPIGGHILGDRSPRRLFALFVVADLHIGAEAAVAQADRQPRIRMVTQDHRLAVRFAVALFIGQRPRKFTVGIVGAADKGAKFAGFDAQAPILARGAFARIGAWLRGLEDMRTQILVEGLEDG